MVEVETGRPAILSHLTLVEHAEGVLGDMIFSGELLPGTRISLDEAAKQLGMSAIPVREALRGLAARGLVEAVARRGFRVRAADSADFADTYDLRLRLDPYAVSRAVPRLSPAAIGRVYGSLAELERTIMSGNDRSYYRDHRQFHFSIYEHCGSRWLLEIISMLWDNSLRYQRLSAGPRGPAEGRVAEHRALAEACALRDADSAAQLIAQHLERTRALVMPLLDAAERE